MTDMGKALIVGHVAVCACVSVPKSESERMSVPLLCYCEGYISDVAGGGEVSHGGVRSRVSLVKVKCDPPSVCRQKQT